MVCHALPNDKARNDKYNDSVNAVYHNDNAANPRLRGSETTKANYPFRHCEAIAKAFHNAIESKQMDCHEGLTSASS